MPLDEIQSSVARWIRAPEGVAKALEREDAFEAMAARAELEQMIRSDPNLDATNRLEIYANAYFYRVLGVLSEDYEALRGNLGPEDFHDLITSYLWIEPSRHPSIREVGRRLPGFLGEHAAAEGFRERSPWAPALADFEWARVDAFDAPDVALLDREDLSALAPDEFGAIPLVLGPWVRLRSSTYPLDELWRAGVGGKSLEIEREACDVSFLIWRKHESVVHRRLDPIESDALREIGQGVGFGELCEWAAGRIGESDAPGLAARWLEMWIADGLLIAQDCD